MYLNIKASLRLKEQKRSNSKYKLCMHLGFRFPFLDRNANIVNWICWVFICNMNLFFKLSSTHMTNYKTIFCEVNCSVKKQNFCCLFSFYFLCSQISIFFWKMKVCFVSWWRGWLCRLSTTFVHQRVKIVKSIKSKCSRLLHKSLSITITHKNIIKWSGVWNKFTKKNQKFVIKGKSWWSWITGFNKYLFCVICVRFCQLKVQNPLNYMAFWLPKKLPLESN